MSHLFEIQGTVVRPHAETLLLDPFKTIWERDTSAKKELATAEFSYMEFMASVKATNPYKNYPDDKKEAVIKKKVYLAPEWKPDELVLEGLKEIEKLQKEASYSYPFFQSAKKAVLSLQDFFNSVDLFATDDKNKPIWKPKDITSALIDTDKLLTNLNQLDKKVEEELYEEVKSRSNKKISPLANPDSLT